eukprot:CAMPEP_0115102650 /NCGR_PEP_ID=MMETSP0227-20121206/34046_1 /TAXON_ID=89957 /ORGANISM="Polarella glacialis, Strain CCMP 1383" /LENGTH=132 /DNA_ID=CAMNT_0002498817 /DNA_START=123 /DNA_END=522 /DNA_ORIENTATION=-
MALCDEGLVGSGPRPEWLEAAGASSPATGAATQGRYSAWAAASELVPSARASSSHPSAQVHAVVLAVDVLHDSHVVYVRDVETKHPLKCKELRLLLCWQLSHQFGVLRSCQIRFGIAVDGHLLIKLWPEMPT